MAEPSLNHGIRPQTHSDEASQSHIQQERAVVSLRCPSRQSKQSLVAPGVRGELLEGGRHIQERLE